MTDDLIQRHDDAHIATLTLDSPRSLNALSRAMIARLTEELDRLAQDRTIRVVILRGAGRAFCAGHDLEQEAAEGEPTITEWHEVLARDVAVTMRLWGLSKPTIAAVHGWCLAGGMEVAMACDLVVAADDAQFDTPEIDVGLWPYMITVPLCRSMPPKRVLELMMTGRRIGAAEADRMGFVTRVVPVADLDAEVDALAATLASKSPVVMRLGRDSFYAVWDQSAADALRLLHPMLTVTTELEDAAEGIAAFMEKRPPVWKGR